MMEDIAKAASLSEAGAASRTCSRTTDSKVSGCRIRRGMIRATHLSREIERTKGIYCSRDHFLQPQRSAPDAVSTMLLTPSSFVTALRKTCVDEYPTHRQPAVPHLRTPTSAQAPRACCCRHVVSPRCTNIDISRTINQHREDNTRRGAAFFDLFRGHRIQGIVSDFPPAGLLRRETSMKSLSGGIVCSMLPRVSRV